jgi:hypothetical protein
MAAAVSAAEVVATRVPPTATASECGGARYGDQQHHQQGQDASRSRKPGWPNNARRVRSHDCIISEAAESRVAAAEAIRVVVAEAIRVVVAVVVCKTRPRSDSNS